MLVWSSLGTLMLANNKEKQEAKYPGRQTLLGFMVDAISGNTVKTIFVLCWQLAVFVT